MKRTVVIVPLKMINADGGTPAPVIGRGTELLWTTSLMPEDLKKMLQLALHKVSV